MTTTLTTLAAREHTADLRRAARRDSENRPQAAVSNPPESTAEQILALRLADADDARAVRRLAELDEDAELTGQVLLALIDGEPVAALSLDDGRVVSDPFVRTRDAVALLRLRAGHVAGSAGRRSRPRLRPRFA